MLVNRRGLIAGGVATLAAVAAAPAALLTSGREKGVKFIVREIFGDDVASDQQLQRFAEAFVEEFSFGEWGRMRRLLVWSRPYLSPVHDAAGAIGFARVENDYTAIRNLIATSFLRSTNFMYRKPGEPVEFTGFPQVEPHVCFNRLARFDYED